MKKKKKIDWIETIFAHWLYFLLGFFILIASLKVISIYGLTNLFPFSSDGGWGSIFGLGIWMVVIFESINMLLRGLRVAYKK